MNNPGLDDALETLKYRTWLRRKLGQRCIENLRNHGFDAHLTPDRIAATELILKIAGHHASFGFGGSVTTRELGLTDALTAAGKTVFDHWLTTPGMTDMDVRLRQGRCDCFLCSANAIAASGEIVNVDGVGNRNNAMTFGCPKVIIIVGMNKVTPDLNAALERIRTVAAPMRAKSLELKTPCAETGICSDCNAPQRICRVTTILHRKPMMTDISIILINESLGF